MGVGDFFSSLKGIAFVWILRMSGMKSGAVSEDVRDEEWCNF